MFYNHCVHIVSALRENKMEFQYPWGTHITVCRFLEDGSQEQVQEVKMLLHTAANGCNQTKKNHPS